MTLLADLTAMHDASTKQLSFDAARINSLGIHDFIASTFKTTQLMIGGVAQAPAPQGTTISLEGTSISWENGTQDLAFPSELVARVRLDFYDADTPSLLLAIVLQDSWKFSRTFPSLQQTFWDNVSVANGAQGTAATPDSGQPVLLFASAPLLDPARNLQLPQGVNFYGHLDKGSGILKQFHWFFGSSDTAPTHGSITLRDSGQPSIIIPVAQTTLTSIFPDHPLDFSIKLINGIEDASEKNVQIFDSGLELTASIQWGGQPTSLSAIVHDENEGVLEVRIDTSLGLPSAADLQNFFGGYNVTADLPAQFQDGKLVEVSGLAFGIGLKTQQIEYTKLVLIALNNQKLTIVPPDVIEVGDLKFYFAMYRGQTPSFILSGLLEIEGVDFTVSARLPNLSISAALEEGNVINLTQIAQHFGLPSGAPKIEITELSLCARPAPASSYYLYAELEEFPVAAHTDGFVINLMSFEFESDATGKTLNLRGLFTIAGTGIEVFINSDNGWRFEGKTRQDQLIPIGSFIDDLAKKFNIDLPDALADFSLKNLDVSFSSGNDAQEFTFTCACLFPIAGTNVEIDIFIDVKTTTTSNQDASAGGATRTGDAIQTSNYDVTVKGKLKVGIEEFDVEFDQTEGSKKIMVSWAQTEGALHFEDVARKFGFSDLPALPQELGFTLKSAFFSYTSGSSSLVFIAASKQGSVVFATELGANLRTRLYGFGLMYDKASINLSNMPLVGRELPTNETIAFTNIQALIASQLFTSNDIGVINAAIAAAAPSDAAVSYPTFPNAGMDAGVTLVGTLNFGSDSSPLSISLNSSQAGNTTELGSKPSAGSVTDAESAATPTPSSDNTKWFNLQRTFGPVYFDKVGVQYKDATLSFLLNAALSAAGLTLSLDGLSVGSPLDHFAPEFKLHGIGIDYQNGPVEIGAAFLRTQGVAEDGTKYDEYDGLAVIKTEEFALSALGSYTKLKGHPSLFIYAFLDYPLGGPAFFFVTGLAAGFGYNRKLIVPSINQVADFPLVKQAVGGKADPNGLTGTLSALQASIPPAVGEIFLAVGIKFNSFKLIDSFALLTVEFGGRFVANILGVSTAVIPTPEEGKDVTPLAEVQIAWKATFDPEEGFLGVNAQLTSNSYILSKDCHLTGGYAFNSWFSGEHAGDFVQTLGGYHPSFVVPAHYPVVPRLAFLWQVSSELTIKGDAYYALTGSALMAGGHLEVTFESGDLKAWLKLGADFLISWKPYHYDASVYVDVGVSYTFDVNLLFGHIRKTISVDVGADLHLWGPDFSGTADIHLWIISFTISFGARASQAPEKISWDTFRTSFLPASEKVCSVAVKDGLVRTIKDDSVERWIINPKNFSLVVNSAVPFKEGYQGNSPVEINLGGAETSFGIGSMEVTPADLHSALTITITRDGEPADDLFTRTPVRKRIPAGLWGKSLTPDLNANTFIDNVPTGFEITPSNPPVAGKTAPMDLGNFKYSSSYFPKGEHYPDPKDKSGFAYSWEPPASFAPSPGLEVKDFADLKDGSLSEAGLAALDVARRKAVSDSLENRPLRDSLIDALNLTIAVGLNGNVAKDFLRAPGIGDFSS